jgi:RimJ/RimL family protein N-acetyltransferase
MAANPKPRKTPPLCRLLPFDPRWAARIVSWVQSAQDAYWVAPRTVPPLTEREVLRWRRPDHEPHMLVADAEAGPIGYGELNRLRQGFRQYWLGHLVVDPASRGRGYGVALTRALLREAFESRGARRVTLVVFPENRAALACYQRAGMRIDGHETHTFAAYGRTEVLVRLAAGGSAGR